VVDQVIRNIVNAGTCLGITLDDVFHWQPTMVEIKSIADCLRICSEMDVTKAILRSLEQSAMPLVPSKVKQDSSGDILETGERLRETLLRPESSPVKRR